MSQRSPMNDRYQADEKKGTTRKSAASAKPKTKAAASVRVQSAEKTPKEKTAAKKAAEKIERQEQRELDAKYYNPPTAEYKKWKRLWWAALIVALISTACAFLLRWIAPGQETLSFIVLGLAYAGIIGGLLIDFTKIRKIRKEYQQEMRKKTTKEPKRK